MNVNGGNADAGTSSFVLAASNTPDHDNDAGNNDADTEDAARKKTLVRDAAAAGEDGGNVDAGTLIVILAVR